ncbi:MAG TPA: aminotransferase class V-fold PLP-dependent enzyme [Bryobacteraceae bacterium]|nr:aminotransferase class V-fold PLP-dependent enzyme [Bryobacteraceae bacterium]
MHRRSFLRAAAGIAALQADSISRARAAASSVSDHKLEEAARDEDYWREIQQAFTVDRNIINLNNGGVCPSPKVVQDAMRRELEFSNMAPAYTMWTVLEPEIENVRTRLAMSFGCDPEEMAITRNASEALEIAQLGIDLKPGDEVITTDQDYPRMITTWQQRERRDGIRLKMISFPTPPPSMDDLYQRFERAITPRTRVIHFCHITNLTGQIFPVKKICQVARSRGIETVVDGAHAFAHFPYRCNDLDCDYYGTSLHKWLLAPHGTGFLYVRKEKIERLWPMMAAPASMNANIRKFEEIGTHPAANHNAIAEALTFHESIGGERKAARLRYLRSLWSERLLRFPTVAIRTSPDPEQSCGVVLVSVEGKKAPALADELWKQHRILVVAIVHKDFEGLRVTPNVYTTPREIDIFATAMEKLIKA